MERLLPLVLLLLACCVAAPVAAQRDTHPVATEAPAPAATTTAEVRLADAVRGVTRGEGQHKGGLFLLWVRQRAEKHLKVTIR